MTPLDWFDVMTPLGAATCIGVVDEIENVEWVVFIKATGEPWFFRNPHVRRNHDVTSGLGPVSPFTEISKKLQRQIDRYRQNGWLSENEAGGN
jgi:hypothetical protein